MTKLTINLTDEHLELILYSLHHMPFDAVKSSVIGESDDEAYRAQAALVALRDELERERDRVQGEPTTTVEEVDEQMKSVSVMRSSFMRHFGDQGD